MYIMVINLFEIYSTNALSSSFVEFLRELTKSSFKLFKSMLNSQYYLIVDTQISKKTSNVVNNIYDYIFWGL
jgi:hypothetical protein